MTRVKKLQGIFGPGCLLNTDETRLDNIQCNRGGTITKKDSETVGIKISGNSKGVVIVITMITMSGAMSPPIYTSRKPFFQDVIVIARGVTANQSHPLRGRADR
jgi:hypothetical protein